MITISEGYLKALQTLESLQGVTKRLEIEEILSEQKYNSYLSTILYMTYNPYLVYNIRKLPTVKIRKSLKPNRKTYFKFIDLLNSLNKREFTGNAAIKKVALLLQECSKEEYFWFTKVLTRDLKLGVNTKTINKVFVGLVPEFNVTLAEKYKEDEDRLSEEYIIEMKIEGVRIYAHNTSEGVILKTRSGKQVFGYEEIEEAVSSLPKGIIYDGEIQSKTFQNTMKGLMRLNTKKIAIFNLFDYITIEDFENKVGNTKPLKERKEFLEEIIYKSKFNDTIKLLQYFGPYKKSKGNSKEIIDLLFDRAMKDKKEGIMIKDWNATLKLKRSYDWMKMKPDYPIELEVIGYKEGKGKDKGKLGSFICELKVDGKSYEVDFGSGLKKKQRKGYWKMRNSLIGKYIQGHHGGITTDQHGNKSLIWPIFECIRHDM